MLKWIILAVFIAGVTMGTFSSSSGVNKSRFGCPSAGGGNENGSDNTNDNGSAENENDNGTANANANANGSANTNGSANENSNANNNTNGTANGNSNGSANTNENSANSNVNDNGDNSGATMNGRFAGTLTGTTTQSLNGTPSAPQVRQLLPSIQFQGAFTPLILPALHYADSTNGNVDTSNLTNVLVGQAQTFTYNDPGPVTLGVSVTEASYLTREFRVVLAFTFNSVSGNLTRTGTGTQTIEGELNGDGNLAISITTEYEVHLDAGAIEFDTVETTELSGTLPRQP